MIHQSFIDIIFLEKIWQQNGNRPAVLMFIKLHNYIKKSSVIIITYIRRSTRVNKVKVFIRKHVIDMQELMINGGRRK